MTRPRVLVSYHFHRTTDLAELVARLGGDVDLFADSGAYSAATTGATIRVQDYAAWLRDWAPLFSVRSNLDVIGDYEAGAANQARLETAGCNPMPVFHVGEPWTALEDLCARHRYVALGGMALHAVGGAKQRPLMAWLVRAFRIAREHGTVFHGFGLTSAQLVARLPFYSIDSSSWTMGQRFGLAYLWDARAWKMRSLFFRNRADVLAHRALFDQHGLPPARVLDPGFMRPGTPTTADDRTALSAASIRAYQALERSLTARHRVPAPPLPRAADTGTKVYLALPGAGEKELAPFLATIPQPERSPSG